MKKYKTILFDSDQTLLDFTMSERVALFETLSFYNVSPDTGLLETYRRCNREAWRLFEQGKMEKCDIVLYRFRKFCEICLLNIDPAEMNDRYLEQLCQTGFLIDGASDVLRTLFGKYTLYIVTNGIDHVQRSRLKNAGITHFFSDVFTSEEIGAPKPSRTYFESVFERIPFQKEQALIIGDSLSSDIAGGIGSGIDTCYINWDHKTHAEDPTYEVFDLREVLTIL